MVEQSAVNRQVIGSNPIGIAKDKVAEWLKHWSAKPTSMSSNLILVSNLEVLSNWLARQTVNLVSKGHVGSSPTTSTIGIYSVIGNIVDLAHAELI